MREVNSVTFVGILSKDATLQKTKAGDDMGCAVMILHRGYKSMSRPMFIYVIAYKDLGKYLAENGKRGSWISVSGKLDVSFWKTEGGHKMTNVNVMASKVEIFPAKSRRRARMEAPDPTEANQGGEGWDITGAPAHEDEKPKKEPGGEEPGE